MTEMQIRPRPDELELAGLTHEQISSLAEQGAYFMDELVQYQELMMMYNCAIREVRTKLEVLNADLSVRYKRNPIEFLSYRIKKPASIIAKMERKGIPISVANIEANLNDIAGIHVICSFIDDIYSIRDSFELQDDVEILQEKDYIANPKENGYRSLHLILRVPIFLSNEKLYVNVEVQFRTIAMDFWASVEHTMKYKKEIRNSEIISEELRYSADLINQLDRRMLQIRDRIERSMREE